MSNLPKITQLVKLAKLVSNPGSLTQNAAYSLTALYLCLSAKVYTYAMYLKSNPIPPHSGEEGSKDFTVVRCSETQELSIANEHLSVL